MNLHSRLARAFLAHIHRIPRHCLLKELSLAINAYSSQSDYLGFRTTHARCHRSNRIFAQHSANKARGKSHIDHDTHHLPGHRHDTADDGHLSGHIHALKRIDRCANSWSIKRETDNIEFRFVYRYVWDDDDLPNRGSGSTFDLER